MTIGRNILVYLCMIVLPFQVWANDGMGAWRMPAEASSDAQKWVEALSLRALDLLKQRKENPGVYRQSLEDLFTRYVYTDWMAKFALGIARKSLAEDDIRRYMDLYRQFLLQKYIPKFEHYTGQTMQIVGMKVLGERDTMVYTKILSSQKDAPPIAVDYRLLAITDENGLPGWRIIDIMAEGVSLIHTHRSEFTALIQKNGFSGFMKLMAQRLNAPQGNPSASLSLRTLRSLRHG
jgi:phospholipid transport system substrate-binding protein